MQNKIFLKKLGQNVKKYRKAKHFTQEWLAEVIGLHPTTVGKIEAGIINSSVLSVEKVAKALEIPVKDLFDFE